MGRLYRLDDYRRLRQTESQEYPQSLSARYGDKHNSVGTKMRQLIASDFVGLFIDLEHQTRVTELQRVSVDEQPNVDLGIANAKATDFLASLSPRRWEVIGDARNARGTFKEAIISAVVLQMTLDFTEFRAEQNWPHNPMDPDVA